MIHINELKALIRYEKIEMILNATTHHILLFYKLVIQLTYYYYHPVVLQHYTIIYCFAKVNQIFNLLFISICLDRSLVD